MTSEEIIRLIFSFLGGGLVASILNWFRCSISEKASRKVEHLSKQVSNLYGPLYFFTKQNESFFHLNNKFQEAYNIEYCSQEWSRDNMTQENLKKDTSCTLDIANKYVRLVTANNEKIMNILIENYACIDPDDIDIFQRFVIDYTRLRTETDDAGTTITPHLIYEHIGQISFMRPEFIERVRTKFLTKKGELKV